MMMMMMMIMMTTMMMMLATLTEKEEGEEEADSLVTYSTLINSLSSVYLDSNYLLYFAR